MQGDLGTLVARETSGTALAERLRAWRDALHTNHSGETRPSYVKAGMTWLDISDGSAWKLKLYSGTADLVVLTVNPATGVLAPFDGRYLRYDDDQILTDAALAQAKENLQGILDNAYLKLTDGWRPFSRMIGVNGTGWSWEAPADAEEFRLRIRRPLLASGAATLQLRCGDAGGAADTAAGSYFLQFSVLQNSDQIPGSSSADVALNIPIRSETNRAYGATITGDFGSANARWNCHSEHTGAFNATAEVGDRWGFRNASGRKPRLFLLSTAAITVDLILEVRN